MIDVSDLIGVKFVRGGIDPGTGVDCLGLVVLVKERMGEPLEIPNFDYSGDWKARVLQYLMDHAPSFEHVRPEAANTGDVVVMDGLEGEPLHVGVMLSRTQMMHCTKETGVTIQRLGRYLPMVRRVLRDV